MFLYLQSLSLSWIFPSSLKTVTFQQIFISHSLHVRCGAGQWRYTGEPDNFPAAGAYVQHAQSPLYNTNHLTPNLLPTKLSFYHSYLPPCSHKSCEYLLTLRPSIHYYSIGKAIYRPPLLCIQKVLSKITIHSSIATNIYQTWIGYVSGAVLGTGNMEKQW